MLTVIMIFLGIAVLLLFDGVLENYFPTTKEYSIQSPKIKEEKKVLKNKRKKKKKKQKKKKERKIK